MPSILSYTNTLLGIQYPQKLSGKTKVQSFLYPGALQPDVKAPPPSVLTSTETLLGMAYPQKLSGKTMVQSFLYPGALQPPIGTGIQQWLVGGGYDSIVLNIEAVPM